MGLVFRELSFSVLVGRGAKNAGQDAAYLVRAFNSNRAFALVERVFFSTPYIYGRVEVSATVPASVSLATNGEIAFRAQMDADARAREPARRGEEGWEGPVFLPEPAGSRRGEGKAFFARLRGHTATYPFVPSQDTVTIRPLREGDVFQELLDSHFAATEWTIREDASHSKSKTYARTELMARVFGSGGR
jgi:hypothetical protein